jgi:hypothetical protein
MVEAVMVRIMRHRRTKGAETDRPNLKPHIPSLYSTRYSLKGVPDISLVVYPAAYLPRYAHEAGAKLIIINMTPTPLDHLADVVIHGKTGEVMRRIVNEISMRLSA